MKKYHYVYVTTNLVNGKKYVGDHSTDNLDDGYLGSGKILKDSIIKYGKDNFKKEILEFFDSKQEAFNAQEKWINEFTTIVPSGYNISPVGGRGVRGWYQHSDETKEKIRKSNKGKSHPPLSEEHKKKLSNIGKGRKQTQEHIIKKANARRGKKFSEESKKEKAIL
jgi:group I intron endonuclease